MIENWMIGKELILAIAVKTNGNGSLVMLCTELGEIKTKLLLRFENDEPIWKDI